MTKDIDAILSRMTLREKIGQTAILDSSSLWVVDLIKKRKISSYLKKYPYGGIFVGEEVIQDGDATKRREWTPAHLKYLIKIFRENSKYPPVICADGENGCGSVVQGKTLLPKLMALAATRSEEMALDYGRAIGCELAEAGIHWSFNPVCDLNYHPMNSMAFIRGPGNDVENACRICEGVVRGMQDSGVMATAKHFPGDGVDFRNQHHHVTCNSFGREQWMKTYGAVYKSLFKSGLGSIMAGHISLPSCQPRDKGLPATLSRDLLIDLLRKKMSFQGVVVSDALCMGGYQKAPIGPEKNRDVECFRAGVDMLLWPDDIYFDAMEKAVSTGYLSLEYLEGSVRRILKMKEKYGVLAETKRPKPKRVVSGPSISRAIAERSLVLVRDRKGRLPFAKAGVKRALVCNIDEKPEAYDPLVKQLKAYGMGVEIKEYMAIEKAAAEDIRRFDLIICALPEKSMRNPLLANHNIWGPGMQGQEKTVIVSFGSPWYVDYYFEYADICINAFSNVPSSQTAVAKLIMGDIQAKGKSPVKLKMRTHFVS